MTQDEYYNNRGCEKTFLVIVIILMLSCVSLFSQYVLPSRSIVSGTFAANDLQLGLRYDYMKTYGFYVGAGHGKYKIYNIDILDHTRISVGMTRSLNNYAQPGWRTYLSFGVNVHKYDLLKTEYLDPRALQPVSFELGVGLVVRSICFGWTFDPVKGDAVINLGYKF